MKLLGNPRKSAVLVLGIAAVVTLAACGSSSKASVTPGAQPASGSTAARAATTSPTTGGAAAAPVVKVAMTMGFGSVLVDSTGMTLYTLTNAGAAVPCTGQCATFWPPLLLSAGTASATGGAGVSGLSTTSGESGTQVTENGLPLYRFSMDKAPGDTKGDGISSFGGTWHVVKASASSSTATTVAPVAPTTVAPATTAPSSGYGGY